MRARRFCEATTALVLVAVLVIACSGCGGVSGAATSQGNQLTVYSSLPLQGPSGALSAQIVDGEKLALHDSGGHIGPFTISYDSMDDSSPTSGQWDPERDRRGRQDRSRRSQHDRLSRRRQLGGHRDLAAVDERRRHPPGQPRQSLRGPDLLDVRRPGRARTVLSDRQAQLRAPAARRSDAGESSGAADARTGGSRSCMCSTTRTRSSCRSPRWS